MGRGGEKVDSAALLGVCNQREARLKPVLFIAARTHQHSLCHHLASSHFALSIQTCSAAVTQQPHMLPATTVTLYKPHKATHYLYQQYFLYKYHVQFFFLHLRSINLHSGGVVFNVRDKKKQTNIVE